MIINFDIQDDFGATMPLMPVRAFTGSSLSLEMAFRAPVVGAAVTAVKVAITNANNTPATATATRLANGHWAVVFASSNFEEYGFVAKGVKFSATYKLGETTYSDQIIGIADLDIIASSANARPGDPDRSYVQKGDEVFVKSYMEDSVQHFVKQTMEYDEDMGAWGANWTGDYILVNGEFVDANPPATSSEEE